MYSDDDSIVSSGSDRPVTPRATARAAAAAAAQAEAAARASNGSSDEAPVLVESDESNDDDEDESYFHGAVEASTVPDECLERCAIFFDAAVFDPHTAPGHMNECVVECSMRVVEYPFCQPTAVAPTQTLIYTPVISASKMTKNMRSITVQRWGHMISGQHGIPCTSVGTSTGFEEMHKIERTYQDLVHGYCHTLRDAKAGARSAGGKGHSSGSSSGGKAATAATAEAQIAVALDEAELYKTMPDIFWNTINAVVQVCRGEHMRVGVAFLTTEARSEEVRRSLMWLQNQAEISLPRYQVFTIEAVLGEPWEDLVRGEKENHNCGYHTHLMTNSYGNRRHCCEGTVTTMTKVMEAAVRNL